jgi:hypothetical protein
MPCSVDYAAASVRNHAGTVSRAWSQRLIVGGQNRIVRPSLKNGTRFALTQRSKVRGATFSSLDSSETLRAESELRSLSAMDRGAAGVTGAIHRPSFCAAFQPHGTSSPLAYVPPVGLDARLVRLVWRGLEVAL